jgi:periplasmic protein TonB
MTHIDSRPAAVDNHSHYHLVLIACPCLGCVTAMRDLTLRVAHSPSAIVTVICVHFGAACVLVQSFHRPLTVPPPVLAVTLIDAPIAMPESDLRPVPAIRARASLPPAVATAASPPAERVATPEHAPQRAELPPSQHVQPPPPVPATEPEPPIAAPLPQPEPQPPPRAAVAPDPEFTHAAPSTASAASTFSSSMAPQAAPATSTAIAPAGPVTAKPSDDESTPLFTADYLRNPKPDYPALSRRRGEQGLVLLRVFVSASGDPRSVDVKQGCGYPRLDQAALDAVKRWRFVPARRAEQPVDAWVVVPIRFSLKG